MKIPETSQRYFVVWLFVFLSTVVFLPSIRAQVVGSGNEGSQAPNSVSTTPTQTPENIDAAAERITEDEALLLELQRQRAPAPKLKDLYKPWLFARASEANTLFIEPRFKAKIPFGHVIKTDQLLFWCEFDGERNYLWKVTKSAEQDGQLTLELGDAGEVLVVPYPEIDHCLLIIRKDPKANENPTRFAVPYRFLGTIPFLKAD